MIALLDQQVLVLNRLWQPVNTCSARRAFTLLFLDHAHVVDCDENKVFSTHDVASWMDQSVAVGSSHQDELIHSVSHFFRLPKIIVLQTFDRLPKKEIKFTRENVFQRDGYTCQYCAKPFEMKELNIDHVIPRDKGGKTTWENVVCSCIRCNTKKANMLPAEANMFPRQTPAAPRWRPFLSGNRHDQQSYDESWGHFIHPDRAAVELTG
ncbi:MAG: 5-methylcytosine-specific restriction endonuclease McrA [Verrucomicrobiales bacterium]